MPPRLEMPVNVSENQAPLIDMLWRFYVAAREPSTKKIAEVIAAQPDDQRNGTANPETVRKTLGALYIPAWPTVEVIFRALCEIADVDPDDLDDSEDSDRWEGPRTHLSLLWQAYQLARHGQVLGMPKTRTERAKAREEARSRFDPWASAPQPSGGGFSDEPPF